MSQTVDYALIEIAKELSRMNKLKFFELKRNYGIMSDYDKKQRHILEEIMTA